MKSYLALTAILALSALTFSKRGNASVNDDNFCVIQHGAWVGDANVLLVQRNSNGDLVGSIVSCAFWKGVPLASGKVIQSVPIEKTVQDETVSYRGKNFSLHLPTVNNAGYMKATIGDATIDIDIPLNYFRPLVWSVDRCLTKAQ